MTLDHRDNHLERLRSGLSLLIYPFQLIVDMPTIPLQWSSTRLTPRAELEDELQKKRTQQLLLKAQLQRMVAVEAENLRLRQLFKASQRISDELMIAEILKVDLDPFSRKVVINKGSNDEVYDGQALLDAYGVMGQTTYVAPHSATAILITDPGHAVPVQVNRNGLRGIAVGTGASDELNIPFIPNNADVKIGDKLVTSGLGGHFPEGYPVAVITQIEIDPTQPYARIIARPEAQIDRSREVLLVKKFNRLEEKP